MSQAKKKFYTVWQGRETGVFATWQDCLEQVKGFKDAKYKSFDTQKEAEAALNSTYTHFIQAKLKTAVAVSKAPKNSYQKPVVPSLSVDAACSGNPGIMEYQGVDTASRQLIFHQGPFAGGTNNIGEFLALVHALAYLKKINSKLPVYTDSRTARSWVKLKKAKTTLARTPKTEKLFVLVDRAITWLENNTYTTEILTWETELWGENPADFGRK